MIINNDNDYNSLLACMSHYVLLNSLHTIGITGTAFKIFVSYLDQRTLQQLRIGYVISEIGQIPYGVPQSMVPSQILYVATLNNLNLNWKIYSYTDDMVIIYV